jgi:hypothetical protein
MTRDGHIYGPPAAPGNAAVQSILLEAESLVNGDRAKQYGPIREDYDRVCAIEAAVLDTVPSPTELAVFRMVCVKLSRIGQELQGKAQHKRDNFVDACGYLSKLNDLIERRE